MGLQLRRRARIVSALAAALAIGLLAACGDDDDATESSEQAAAEPPHFSYSGADGPENWGELDPTYAACSRGKSQSPIDLANGTPSAKPELEIDYRPAEVELENNGHSVEAVYPAGSSITLDGTEYGLDQFHFHAPAEHLIDGGSNPIEFHFVNKTPDESGVAVLGLQAKQGAENPAFSGIVDSLPAEEDETATAEGEVDASEILPADAATAERWSYDGSLTTPACTQGVHWIVLNEPIEMSAEQIAAFTEIYEGNNRPVQPLNGREVLLTGQP